MRQNSYVYPHALPFLHRLCQQASASVLVVLFAPDYHPQKTDTFQDMPACSQRFVTTVMMHYGHPDPLELFPGALPTGTHIHGFLCASTTVPHILYASLVFVPDLVIPDAGCGLILTWPGSF